MLNKIRDILLGKGSGASDGKPATEEDAEKESRIAVCALLLEIANFDGDFHDDERSIIETLIRERFGLTSDEADELIELSHNELKESIDLWHFAKHINKSFSKKERIHLIEMLWHVVYADGHLHGHEDFLIHKLATLLKLEHKDLIDAKIKVKNGF